MLLILAIVVVVTGCGGNENDASENNAGAWYDVNNNNMGNNAANWNSAADDAVVAPDDGNSSEDFIESESWDDSISSSDVAVEDTRRIVIMSARMTISSWNPEVVIDSVASMAEHFGGHVVSSNLRQVQGPYGVEIPEANITIRVPAARLQQAVETIKGMADEVIYASQWGQDVTREYTDLQSRLTNLEEAAAQLQAIMDAADETEDVLDVYDELAKVNEEAELIRGQMQYYEQAAALSSIELTIIQIREPTPTPTLTPTPTPTLTPTPTPTRTPQPWLPGETFEEASEDLTTAFQRWINWMIRFFVYFLPTFIFRAGPWLLVFFFVGRWAYRRFIKPPVKEE
jgi:hypothetical protein